MRHCVASVHERDDDQSYYKLPTDGAEPSFDNTDFLKDPTVQNWLRWNCEQWVQDVKMVVEPFGNGNSTKDFQNECFTDTPPTVAFGSASETDEPSQMESSFMDFFFLLFIIALVGCLFCAVGGCIMKLRKLETTPS